MYRVTEIRYVNIMASAFVIVVTNFCVPTFYIKNWMPAQLYSDIKCTVMLKIYNLFRNMLMEYLILHLYFTLHFTIWIHFYFSIFLLLDYYLYEFAYRLWNILTVLLNVIFFHIHISLMFCHYLPWIYSYRLWNVLTVSFTKYCAIFIFPSCSVTTYPVYTATDCEMY